MKVRDVLDEGGLQSRSFQVSNTLVSRTDFDAIIATVPGARILQGPQGVWLDDVCRFIVGSVEFEVWEPYGDSDCYWVGTTVVDPPELQQVRQQFQRYNRIAGHHHAGIVAALVLAMAFGLLLSDLTGTIPVSAVSHGSLLPSSDAPHLLEHGSCERSSGGCTCPLSRMSAEGLENNWMHPTSASACASSACG